MVELTLEYNGSLMALSVGVAFLGFFAAISLCEQHRLAMLSACRMRALGMMALVTISFGGVGVWATQCIAAESFKLYLDGVHVPVRFNRQQLFVSLAVVCLIEFVGMYCASTDSCFNKSKSEIMDLFIQQTSNKYTLAEVKHMGRLRVLWIVLTHSLQRIVCGGIITGGGVCLTHYLGMTAMEFQGTVSYNPGRVAATVVVALTSLLIGIWVFFRVLSVYPSLDILRIVCALNGTLTLCGVHYLGMASATFEFDPTKAPPDPNSTIGGEELLLGIVAASVVFCVAMLVYVLSDLRGWLRKTNSQLYMADAVINHMYTTERSISANHSSRRFGLSTPNSSVRSPSGRLLPSTSSSALPGLMAKYMRKYGGEAGMVSGSGRNPVHIHRVHPSPNNSSRSSSFLALYNESYYGDEDEDEEAGPAGAVSDPESGESQMVRRARALATRLFPSNSSSNSFSVTDEDAPALMKVSLKPMPTRSESCEGGGGGGQIYLSPMLEAPASEERSPGPGQEWGGGAENQSRQQGVVAAETESEQARLEGKLALFRGGDPSANLETGPPGKLENC